MSNVTKGLGLSKLERQAYLCLAESEQLTAKSLANQLGLVTQGVYRPIRDLLEKGFIVKVGKHPAFFRALPPEIALTSVFRKTMNEGFLGPLDKRKTHYNLPLEIVTSRETYHKKGETLFKRAEKSVYVIASGTGDLSADFIKTMTDKVKLGVDYKIISLTYEKVNREKIKNWKRNGFKVRYKSGEGINLVVYDENTVQLGLRIAEVSKEKIGIIIKNESVALYLSDFYQFLWEDSKEL